MSNIFGNRVFMPGDLVRRTKGAGGSKQSRLNVWRILEIKDSGMSKGAVTTVELIEGSINKGNNKTEGPGYRNWYWLRELTHVEA